MKPQKITFKIQDQYNDTQKKALAELKKQNAWEIFMDMCDKIRKKSCDLTTINQSLSDREFKIEYKGRKLADEMFTAVIGDTHPLSDSAKPKKTYL